MKKKKGIRFGSVLLQRFQRSGVKRRSSQKKSSVLRIVHSPQSRTLKLSQIQGSSLSELQKKKKSRSVLSDSQNTDSQADTHSQLTLELKPAPPPVQVIPESQVTVLAPEDQTREKDGSYYSEITTYDLIKPKDRLKQSIEGFLLDQRSEHTRKAYGKDLKRFMKFLHGRNLAHGIDSMNRTVLIAYKESLLSDGLEHTSVDRHLATLRSFFKWLVDDGLLSKSPAEGVRFMNPKRLSTTIGFSDEEVKKLLAMPDLHTRVGSLHYAILMILFYCGLRRSEVCGLRTSSVGTERNQHILRLRGKGNAERIIVMITPVWSALKHYFHITQRKMTDEDSLFKPVRNNRGKTTNKPLDPSMIFYIVTKYAKQAGIANRVSPHSCRATAISNARDHNVPDRAIQEFAGWASPDMITRYDKRKSSIEKSAAFSILYGAENRAIPVSPDLPVQELASTQSSGSSTSRLEQKEKGTSPAKIDRISSKGKKGGTHSESSLKESHQKDREQKALLEAFGEPSFEENLLSPSSPTHSPQVQVEDAVNESDNLLKQQIAKLIQELKSDSEL